MPSSDTAHFPVVRAADIPREEIPRVWLIEDLWAASAVGIIGAQPKSLKTFLALEMAISVATGTPCLGRYAVREPGRALLYLAEDSLPTIRERIAALADQRGRTLEGLDLYVITTPTVRLDLPGDRVRLLETTRHLKPRILVLDPLVRLHRLNENASNEVAELLSYLRDLQRELDLAVVLVHHTRKNGPAGHQGGQGLRGSGDFHAWCDSRISLRRIHDVLTVSVEHRAAPSPEPVAIRLQTNGENQPRLVIADTPTPTPVTTPLESRITALLSTHAPITRGALRDRLSVKNQRLGQALDHLLQEGRIERRPDGWQLTSAPITAVPLSCSLG